MSTSTDHLVALHARVERRFYPRVTPSLLIYVAFGPNNLGMLVNVSENGLLVSTPQGLRLNSVYRVSLRLNGLPDAIKVNVRTVWTTESRTRSGIQLLDLSEHDREQIRKWGALQTSQNENLESLFSAEDAKPSPDAAEPPLVVAASPEKSEPALALVAPSPSFKLRNVRAEQSRHDELPVPHNAVAPRTSPSSTRWSKPMLIVWSASMVAICLATAWPYRNSLSDRFLSGPAHYAKESAPSVGQSPTHSPSSVALHTPVALAPSVMPAPKRAAPKTVAAPAAPKASLSNIPVGEALEAKPPAARPNLTAAPQHPAEVIETPETSDSNVADSSSNPLPTNDALPATNPSTDRVTLDPAATPPSANISANNDSTAKILSSDAVPSKSAITGSISRSTHPNDLRIGTSSIGASIPVPPPAFPPRATAGSTTYVERRPDSAVIRPDPSVIHMDVPEARVIELTPPRGRSASFVNLPGERVVRSASVTMHIQRSVLVPGDHWLWRSHKKVALGELNTRVDPQISHLPTTSGTITVQATIDKDGFVTNLKPLNGSFAFLPTVTRAIREWRYEPTYLDNKPVETQAQIEINFHPPTSRAPRP